VCEMHVVGSMPNVSEKEIFAIEECKEMIEVNSRSNRES
jgi:hypothetical protein